MLLPDAAEFYLDRQYVFYAAGLLRQFDDGAAFGIMRDSMTRT